MIHFRNALKMIYDRNVLKIINYRKAVQSYFMLIIEGKNL